MTDPSPNFIEPWIPKSSSENAVLNCFGHVVCCPRIEDPPPVILVLSPVADLGEHPFLRELHTVLIRCITDPQPKLLLTLC
jgi:hypothetical protein